MFDLPTKTKKDKKNYTDFRRHLLGDGFDMMQYSVYTRLCPSIDILDKHAKKVEYHSPKNGSVRVICLTNQQYAEMKILCGKKSSNERHVTSNNLTLF